MTARGGAHAESTTGWVTIVSATPRNAVARIDYACDGILSGDHLVPYAELALPAGVDRTNATGTPDFTKSATVVTGVDGRTIGGGRDFVLVHLRREEGVAPGARYAVYYGSKKRGAPDQSFAEAVVVSVFGDQSLLRVTDARDAVSDGDRLFLRVGGVELTAESADPSPPAERVGENAARIARLVTETIRPTVESPVDSEELAASVTFEDLHFDFDRYTLRQESLAELDQVIETLNAHPSYHLKIEGHTCNVGTPEYNLALGERRAAAVRDYFISHGVVASRLSVVSYGEDDPKFDNSHKDTRKLNRRAALVVEVSNPSPASAVKTSRAR